VNPSPPGSRSPREVTATLEGLFPSLDAAAAAAARTPSAATARAAAEQYRRAGVFDKTLDYLLKALEMDTRDAATHEGLARLWRDAGFPAIGMGYAWRAAYFAPNSPSVHNTLGTIFQALGQQALARAQYAVAFALDASAAYSLNNLCYGWVLQGDPGKAISACGEALRIDPRLNAARNNLALAYAALGNLAAATAEFARAGDRAAEQYNLGIVYLARGNYPGAAAAFEAARAERPAWDAAEARARQARNRGEVPARASRREQ
jgi:Flp pilus assembly protein TadD